MPKRTTSPTSPWSVSGDEAAELFRVHREQLLAYEAVAEEPPEKAKGKASRPKRLTRADVPDDVGELMKQYERSRPGVRLTLLRSITIGGPEGTTVAGAAELPDEGLVSLVVTRTIADAERTEVTSRILVARAARTKRAS